MTGPCSFHNASWKPRCCAPQLGLGFQTQTVGEGATAKRWGKPNAWRREPVFYLNSMLAAASNWVEISEKAACAFTHLLAAVRAAETGEDPGVQMAVGTYMQCILQYELVGRRGADKPGWEFGWDSIQAYGAKFPFSDGLGLLKRLACINSVCTSTCQCKPCTVCAQVDQMYSFFGPSPRVLYEEAVGRHDPLSFTYFFLSKPHANQSSQTNIYT